MPGTQQKSIVVSHANSTRTLAISGSRVNVALFHFSSKTPSPHASLRGARRERGREREPPPPRGFYLTCVGLRNALEPFLALLYRFTKEQADEFVCRRKQSMERDGGGAISEAGQKRKRPWNVIRQGAFLVPREGRTQPVQSPAGETNPPQPVIIPALLGILKK